MRVGIVFEYPTVNGGENSMFAVIEWLLADARSLDLELVALCPSRGAVREQLDGLGVELVAFDRHAVRREAASNTGGSEIRERQVAALVAAVEAVRPDVLHANSLAMGRLLGAAAAQLPCPTTSHLRDILKLSKAAVRDLNQNSRLIAVSEATREFHIAQGLTVERSCVVHNGVAGPAMTETPCVIRQRIREELGIPTDADVLLTVGQIGLRKGLDTLAEAARKLAVSGRSLHWMIAGERFSQKQESVDFERQVFAAFQSAGPTVTTHRLGYRRDVADLMLASDLLVHGARQEPLGRVLLEAAALKLPIIATDVGGTREILEDGVSGKLVPADDSAGMATVIEHLLKAPKLRLGMADAAAERVARDFSVERSARQLVALWRAARDEKKSRPEA